MTIQYDRMHAACRNLTFHYQTMQIKETINSFYRKHTLYNYSAFYLVVFHLNTWFLNKMCI